MRLQNGEKKNLNITSHCVVFIYVLMSRQLNCLLQTTSYVLKNNLCAQLFYSRTMTAGLCCNTPGQQVEILNPLECVCHSSEGREWKPGSVVFPFQGTFRKARIIAGTQNYVATCAVGVLSTLGCDERSAVDRRHHVFVFLYSIDPKFTICTGAFWSVCGLILDSMQSPVLIVEYTLWTNCGYSFPD